jgi:hypothetical protein
MRARHKALFVPIVPSPYQRDLFGALAAREDVDLSVYYLERGSPDSPWPRQPLRPLSGSCQASGSPSAVRADM